MTHSHQVDHYHAGVPHSAASDGSQSNLYRRTSPSSPPLAIRQSLRPTHVTGPSWPVKVRSHLPVRGSQTFLFGLSAFASSEESEGKESDLHSSIVGTRHIAQRVTNQPPDTLDVAKECSEAFASGRIP